MKQDPVKIDLCIFLNSLGRARTRKMAEKRESKREKTIRETFQKLALHQLRSPEVQGPAVVIPFNAFSKETTLKEVDVLKVFKLIAGVWSLSKFKEPLPEELEDQIYDEITTSGGMNEEYYRQFPHLVLKYLCEKTNTYIRTNTPGQRRKIVKVGIVSFSNYMLDSEIRGVLPVIMNKKVMEGEVESSFVVTLRGNPNFLVARPDPTGLVAATRDEQLCQLVEQRRATPLLSSCVLIVEAKTPTTMQGGNKQLWAEMLVLLEACSVVFGLLTDGSAWYFFQLQWEQVEGKMKKVLREEKTKDWEVVFGVLKHMLSLVNKGEGLSSGSLNVNLTPKKKSPTEPASPFLKPVEENFHTLKRKKEM